MRSRPRHSTSSHGQTNFCERRIVLLGYPALVLLDLVGPCEVFSIANRISRRIHPEGPDPYKLEVVTVDRKRRIPAMSGLTLVSDCHFRNCRGSIDTLLIPGSPDTDTLTRNTALLKWLAITAPCIRRVGSVCTGAFVLAAAGLLEGRRATTHWDSCQRLARDYPGIFVEPDRIYIKDGNVYTSAGVTAGMDLALALVEEDLGKDIALNVARTLVMFLRRPGGQSQFSVLLESQAEDRQPIRDLKLWIAEHLDQDLSVETMAARVNMSVRNFSRAFQRDVRKTPAQFVEMLRLETACRRLEGAGDALDTTARACGFGSANSMRRSFIRVLGVTPRDYRSRFA